MTYRVEIHETHDGTVRVVDLHESGWKTDLPKHEVSAAELAADRGTPMSTGSIVAVPLGAGAKYRWKILKDHIETDAVGVEGPRNLDPKLTANRRLFKMYCDDKVLSYEGEIFGDFDGFEPLDDFGTANAGLIHIKLNDGPNGKFNWV